MKLARIAVDRPVTMYMFYSPSSSLASVSLGSSQSTFCPISAIRASRHHQLPGVAPRIETLVTAPLDRPSAASRPAPGRVGLEGRVSLLTLEFDWGTDMDFTMLHTRSSSTTPRTASRGRREPTIIPPRPAEPADHGPWPSRRPDASSSSRAGRGAHQAAPSSRSRASVGRDHRRGRARDPGRGRSPEARPLRVTIESVAAASTPSRNLQAGRSAGGRSNTPSASSRVRVAR